ncbi:ATP-binding protein [Arthrobacter sp. FW305-BF8]|uniref:sensor histidine kinase n=1 Tax=Arthrobacter sp. FW305-BF8 TaxID=2879617 RepID=UPI001F1ACC21|nr:ATP-binding protein [Arthrobacter sp. FW305-BF8]UKA53783.1 ATP-binding protein [Arthrobacter sp. FW305-BF8]
MNQSATLEEVVEVGGVITDRQPLDFYRLGLAGCIDRLTVPLRREGTCVHWETPHHGVEISSGCASVLYQSAQEALSNTFRHAHATDVTVRLTAVFHGIRLMVADNGTGFESVSPAAGHVNGHGLRTISQAVDEVGGTVDITSAPGTGTAITITIPLD